VDKEKTTDDPRPSVFSISDLIQYQDGAVVSRVVLKSPGGSVTLFAFDKLQTISEHTTPHEALIQVLDGKGEVTIDGIAYPVGQGEMILLPADHPHAVSAISKFKMVLTMLRHDAKATA
jgi:quercetin dioxygenase-like cupin family protein